FVQPARRPLPRRLFDPSRQLSAASVGDWWSVCASLVSGGARGTYWLAPEAQKAFEACYARQIADEVEGGRVPAQLRPQWSKLINYAARLTLIPHLLRCAEDEEGEFVKVVSPDTVRAAWRLVEYLKSHQRAVLASPAARAPALTQAARAAEPKKAEL